MMRGTASPGSTQLPSCHRPCAAAALAGTGSLRASQSRAMRAPSEGHAPAQHERDELLCVRDNFQYMRLKAALNNACQLAAAEHQSWTVRAGLMQGLCTKLPHSRTASDGCTPRDHPCPAAAAAAC